MKHLSQKIMMMLLLLTISSRVFAGLSASDLLPLFAAMWQHCASQKNESSRRAARIGERIRLQQAIARARGEAQRVDQQPIAQPVQQNYRWSWHDKTVLASMGACLAYFAAYTLFPTMKSYVPHPDYIFSAGSAGMAAWFAHKAYTARCENSTHKLIRNVVGIGAIASAFYAVDFMVRSKV